MFYSQHLPSNIFPLYSLSLSPHIPLLSKLIYQMAITFSPISPKSFSLCVKSIPLLPQPFLAFLWYGSLDFHSFGMCTLGVWSEFLYFLSFSPFISFSYPSFFLLNLMIFVLLFRSNFFLLKYSSNLSIMLLNLSSSSVF